MYEKKGSLTKHIDFMFLDLLCLELAYFIAFRIRNLGILWLGRDPGSLMINVSSTQIHTTIAILFAIIDVLLVVLRQPYKDVLRRGYLVEFANVCIHNTNILVAMLVYLYVTQEAQQLSRAVFFLTWGLSILFMYVVRLLWKAHIRRRLTQSEHSQALLLVAPYTQAEALIREIHERRYNEYRLCGVVILDQNLTGTELLGEKVVADESTMFDFCLENVVDAVLLSHMVDEKKQNEFVNRFLAMGQTVHINLNTVTGELPNKMVQRIGSLMVLTTSVKTVDGRLLFVKRIMDIISGIIGCMLTLLVAIPLLPIVKFQAPGPLLFSQIRVGKNGRKFRIYKFRSMYVDAEARKAELMKSNEMQGLMFKMENDPRIFPAGHFIRKYSLDELPQFFNILKGDMSLVGTRPPTVDEYEHYDQHHKIRLSIKPGLTGLWQVSGRSNIKDFDEVVRLDEEYIKNWSLGLDCRIILKTFRVVLGGDGSM